MFVNRSTTIEKELAQFLGVKAVVALAIKSEPDATTGIQAGRRIIEKKSPLLGTPERRTLVAVEADHEGGNEIEFAVESGQRSEGLDA